MPTVPKHGWPGREATAPFGFPGNGTVRRHGGVGGGRQRGREEPVSRQVRPPNGVVRGHGVLSDAKRLHERSSVHVARVASVFSDDVHNQVGPELLQQPGREGHDEEVAGLFTGEADEAVASAEARHLQAWRAADEEHECSDREH